MSETVFINGLHLNYLGPLVKWRILDLQTMLGQCNYSGSAKAFRKLIVGLERKNLIKSYIDPQSKKKYVHLTDVGESYLGVSEGRPSVSRETFFHDCKVSEICRELLSFNTVKEIQLEHELVDRSSFHLQYKVCPDALITGEKKGVKFKVAFELELTRKTQAKYVAKAKQYFESTVFDYAFYFFASKGVYESYKASFKDAFGDKFSQKIMLGHNGALLSKDCDISKTKIYFEHKEVAIEQIFQI
jgi:hypothetical protein